ncbi:MAG: hypothetical protein JNJ49_03815 [Bdellovibrionaceae bacterium]|nr:hypothetical protein [Pseudobdellovibrionaceae bacterium]
MKLQVALWFSAVVVASAMTVSSCAVKSVHEGDAAAAAAPDLKDVANEVSLKADRSAMDEARKDIPEEIRRENDEIAGLLSFVVRESDEDPSRLRDRFSSALRKKRERSDRELRKKRDDFTATERKRREEFLKKLKTDRDEFTSGRRRSPEERKRFFDDQDTSRRDFFSNERDLRKDFESSMQETRKNTEDYIREKQNAFNQDLRAYQQRYTERKRTLDLKKRAEEKARSLERAGKPVHVAPLSVSGGTEPEARALPASTPSPDPLAEFDRIPSGPGVPLAPGKKGP